jgi:TolB-like protein
VVVGKFKLDLIGPFRLATPDGIRIEVTSKKGVAMLALLATAPSGERTRSWLQTMLWGSRAEEQAQSSLRRELSTLRKLLAAAGADALISSTSQRIGLDVNRLEIDVYTLGMRLPELGRTAKVAFLEGLDLRDCEEFEDWLRDERDRVADMLALQFSEPLTPPLSAHDILGTSPASAQELVNDAPMRVPPKPSVAVLPFTEVGGDADGWLGIGLADEVGVILSQYPQLFIVASTSARALVEQRMPKDQIAARLGVRYLLDGTVMQVGSRLRVSVALLEGQTGEQIWAELFSGKADDLFEIQTAIASRIAPQIWSKVDIAERRRGLRLVGPARTNYELYWRANALFRSWEKDAVFEAIALTEQLVADDPTCPWAASLAAYCHSIAYLLNYDADRETSLRRAILHYQVAVRYGDDNVEALGYAAGTLLNIGGDLVVADRLIAHALELLPAHQPTLFWGGWIDLAAGRADRARDRLELALRINPATGARSQTLCGLGFASLLLGAFDDAYCVLKESAQGAAGFFLSHAGLCVAATMVGDDAEAARARAVLQASGQFDFVALFQNPAHRLLFRAALEDRTAVAVPAE